MNAPTLADRVLMKDPRAIARAISIVEDEAPDAAALVGRIFPRTGRAYLIGITGAPGAGKSTLVDRVIVEFRRLGQSVGVLAVDPTSPYTGGAILGDRVRMQAHAEDPGVFIRSMATRGNLGGLARTTADAAMVLNAAGFDIVIIETVGVGQDEVDIVRTADVSVVTVVPGTGDDVQALKAGIMEIADVFVVNKADRDGADRTAASIESMLSLEEWASEAWRPPVLRTVATTGVGVSEVVATIAQFRTRTGPSVGERRRARVEWRVRELLARQFLHHVEHGAPGAAEFSSLLDRVAGREVDPYEAARLVMSRAMGAQAGVALHHVGIAVRDAAEIVAFLQEAFGMPSTPPIDVPSQRVSVRFIGRGGALVETVSPLAGGSPIDKFLDTRGPGLHHIAIQVPDIDAALAALRARGVKLIDQAPREGAHGGRIAFIHPSSTGNVLLELVQP